MLLSMAEKMQNKTGRALDPCGERPAKPGRPQAAEICSARTIETGSGALFGVRVFFFKLFRPFEFKEVDLVFAFDRHRSHDLSFIDAAE